MKKISIFTFLILFMCTSFAVASPDTKDILAHKSLAMVVFLEKPLIQDKKVLDYIRNTLNDKLKGANITIYADEKPKSPEYLEFVERVQTDPINEKGIRYINTEHLLKYGKDVNAEYIALVTMTGQHDLQLTIKINEVKTGRNLITDTWCREDKSWIPKLNELAEYLTKVLTTEYNWSNLGYPISQKNKNSIIENKTEAILFLPGVIQERPELVQNIKQTIMEKFKINEVPIFIDNKPKSQEFLELIGKISIDSAKQHAFVVKKENLLQYGKALDAKTLVIMAIKIIEREDYWSYRLKQDISVLDIETDKYLFNVVYDTETTKKRQEGIEELMNKFKNDFKLSSVNN